MGNVSLSAWGRQARWAGGKSQNVSSQKALQGFEVLCAACSSAWEGGPGQPLLCRPVALQQGHPQRGPPGEVLCGVAAGKKNNKKNKTKQEHLYSGQGPQVLIAPKCTLLTSKVVSSCFVVLQALLGIGACLGVGCKELKGLALLFPFCNEFRCRLMHSWVQQASWCSSSLMFLCASLSAVCVCALPTSLLCFTFQVNVVWGLCSCSFHL